MKKRQTDQTSGLGESPDDPASSSGASGASGAVARYFALSQPQLRAYIRSIVFNRSDVDDILQDVAVTAFENAERYDGSRPVNAWVIGIARNKIMKYIDKHKRQKTCFSTEVVEAITDAATTGPDKKDSLDSLQGCLEKLDPKHRTLLVRRHETGVTARQLAKEIGYTDTRMSRLINSLYATLMKCVSGEQTAATR
ncbi:MAG: sigma-70 family RNA polymerase sigma factor [Rubripirellula sp.]